MASLSLRTSVLMFIVLCAVGRAAPTAKTDRDRAELKGLVKTVEISWKANHQNESGEVEERELGSAAYDKDGALLSDRSYTGAFVRERKAERRGPTETLFHSPMGDSLERYVLDAAGNITELRQWYKPTADGAPNIFNRMTYDAAGREVSLESFDEDNKSIDLTLYTRDARGLVTVEEDRPRDRHAPYPRLHYTYELDAHGNWIEKDVRRENVSDVDYDYRYAGNLFRTITYY
jgi:hypothetical protein